MTAFNGQICVKTPTRILCSSSPIVECGREQGPIPADPYAHLPARSGDPDDPAVFLAEVEKVINSRSGILRGKGDGVLRTIMLLLHHEVAADQPFVVTALTC
jgi:hypothetical protein